MAPESITPVPDPTRLTQEAVDRIERVIKETLALQVLDIERQIKGVQKHLDVQPQEISEAISNLRQLMDEKFKGVADQFASNAVALAAALLAQKTSVDEQNKSNSLAVSKSDTAVTKQIDAIGAQISATSKATDDKIDDLKSRVQSIEGHSKGSNDTWAYIVGIGGLVIAAVTVIVMMSSRSPGYIQVPATPALVAPTR